MSAEELLISKYMTAITDKNVGNEKDNRANQTKHVVPQQERLKSALYLRLKKRKTFFLEKNLKFSKKKILSENVTQCRKM